MMHIRGPAERPPLLRMNHMERSIEEYRKARNEQSRLCVQRRRAKAKENGDCVRCCKNKRAASISRKSKKPHMYCQECIDWFKGNGPARHAKRTYGGCFLPDNLPTIRIKKKKK